MTLPNEIIDLKQYDYYLTVGKLREFLAAHPEIDDDAKVLVERVHDGYYENHNWSVVYQESDECEMLKNWCEKTNEAISDEEWQNAKSQYTPAFCCVKYDDNLYLNLHY